MFLNNTLSMNELFASEAKHSSFPWYSSSQSRFFQHGPYDLGFKSKHPGFDNDQVGTKGCTKKLLFGRFNFWSKKNHYNPTLTKLAPYKSTILKFLYSMKPENCSAPNILCNLNHPLIPHPSDAASGISTLLKLTPYFLLSLGALRLYHNHGRLPLKPAQIMLYKKQLTHCIKHVNHHRIVYMTGLGTVTSVLSCWETIPYSRRKHFVIIPAIMDTSFGDYLFEKLDLEYKILPLDHPHNVQARSISYKIFQALQRDLKIKKMSDLEFGSMNIKDNFNEKEVKLLPWWSRTKFSTRHLEGINWEVVVSDEHSCSAHCLPGGRIVLYKGLFTRYKSDAEVAAIIGHEVGHIVARHTAETWTQWLWFFIPAMQKLEKFYRGCQRTENEADYIGLLLMASAGYDPRVAPKVYEMLDHPTKHRTNLSTHPSGKQRSEALSKPEVMEEAMIRFSEATKRQRCRN